MTLTQADKDNLAKLAEKATPGPWETLNYATAPSEVINSRAMMVICKQPKFGLGNNLPFIAAANPQVVLALLAENKALARHNAAYLSELDKTWDALGMTSADVEYHEAATAMKADRDQLQSRLDRVLCLAERVCGASSAPYQGTLSGALADAVKELNTYIITSEALSPTAEQTEPPDINTDDLIKQLNGESAEDRAMIKEDMKPGGLFDQVFAKKAEQTATPAPGMGWKVSDKTLREVEEMQSANVAATAGNPTMVVGTPAPELRTPGTVEVCELCRIPTEGLEPGNCWRNNPRIKAETPCPIRKQEQR